VDVGPANPYLALVMLRKLLTLLAVLTGLAAIAAPAEARIAAVDGVQVELSGGCALQSQAAKLAASEVPADAIACDTSQALIRPRAALAIAVPAVRVGIDRARE
jgi:hypothetical protein